MSDLKVLAALSGGDGCHRLSGQAQSVIIMHIMLIRKLYLSHGKW